MSAIADEKYVRLTTFTKDGRRKETPVWIAELGDGTVGFTTGSESWKARRIRNTAIVELAPSNMKGVATSNATVRTGKAIITTGAATTTVERAIKAKYGFQVSMVKLAERLRSLTGKSNGDTCGVVITLD